MRDDAFHHEVFGGSLDRLQPGHPVSHSVKVDLAPGTWLLQVTITAGLSNVNVATRLVSDQPGVKFVGGAHNGAMSPYFGTATVIAFIDDLTVKQGQKVELEVTFEAVGPNAVALLGQRVVAVLARRHAPAPAKAVKPEPAADAVKPEPKAAPTKAAAKATPAAKAAPAPAPAAAAAPVKVAKAAEPKPAAKAEPAKPAAKAAAKPAKAEPAPAKPEPVKAEAKPAAKKPATNKRK